MRSGKTLSGCARALAAVFLSSTKPARAIQGVTGAAQLQLSIFWHQFNPVSGKLLLGQHPKSLIALVCTPSRWVLFPYLKQRQG